MSRESVVADRAPRPIGPYSQAVRCQGLVFTSGQLGIDPETGALVSGDIARETEQVLRNLAAVLDAAGSGMDRVVKVTVFLTDISQFGRMNEVYARHFAEPAPARSAFQVGALPKGAAVEIEAVAEV
ncbi:RidA family protein [candidate division WOR-3 bacterium]|nr:RidA family protein [candidate division WOR-3 bacterium]